MGIKLTNNSLSELSDEALVSTYYARKETFEEAQEEVIKRGIIQDEINKRASMLAPDNLEGFEVKRNKNYSGQEFNLIYEGKEYQPFAPYQIGESLKLQWNKLRQYIEQGKPCESVHVKDEEGNHLIFLPHHLNKCIIKML